MTRTDPAGHDDVPERFQIDFTGQTLLGLYRIERRLADGGMGSVYLAEDTNLGRRVVVKVPHARFLGEPGFRARFRREIEELVRLEHPHVVRILARGEQEGIPFFVLQYLGGGSLEDLLAKGPQTPEAALGWLEPIAETLDFVHGRSVVHRDVKPANILFDGEGHVFLSDFGVVKALGKDDGADLTAVGTGIGSPVYMAPEQGMGQGVSAASDQYALASALYEALAGAPPFGRGSVVEVLVRKGREEAPPLRRLAPGVPETCEAAIARALARVPAERFPTCSAFADAYRRGLLGAGGHAAPRQRVPVLVALALFAVLLGVAMVTRGFGFWEPDSPAPATVPPVPALEDPLHLLRLTERGAEPRSVLRWTFSPGRREARLTRMEHRQSMQLDQTPAMVMSGVSEQDYEVRVDAVDEAGSARLEWRFPPGRPLLEGGATEESVAAETKILAALGTLLGTSRMAPTGVPLEASVRAERKLDSQELTILTTVEQTMRQVSVRFPDEPVGVGARWEITQIKQIVGMRYLQTATYEVLTLEGPRVRLGFKFTIDAPDQALALPGQPEEVKGRVLKFDSEGSGETLLDLGRTIPLENTSKGSVVYVAEVTAPETGTLRFEQSFETRTTPR